MTARRNSIYTRKYQAFIKWVGGTRGLLKQLLPLFPKEFKKYHELFLGGGVVFFELYSKDFYYEIRALDRDTILKYF